MTSSDHDPESPLARAATLRSLRPKARVAELARAFAPTLSRRRATLGLGALVGAAALAGCGDSEGGSETDAGTTGGGTDGSTGEGSSSSDAGSSSSATTGDTTEDPGIEVCEAPDATPEELLANIDHIVVVMMENRSFDHMMGALALAEALPVNGLTGAESNSTLGGDPIGVFNLDHFISVDDPPHGWSASREQWNLGQNDGFVRAYEEEGASDPAEIMGYYVRAQLPISYALADEYVLCDRWHASVLGPTWPNRFYLHLASSDGNMGNDAVQSELPSIFSACAEKGVSAKYYASNLPFPVVYGTHGSEPHMAQAQDFFEDAAAGNLPSFCMIEPTLTAFNVIGNDDHPPADVQDGQGFLATVYNALAQSPNWARTLLIVTYDEHGGYYDHVSPPEVFDERPEFRQLGFRVPSFVIGAQVRRGCANGLLFDHVSVAATVTRRFGLTPLNERVTMTADLSSCIDPARVNDPRPPIALPMVRVRRPRVIIPGGNFGGQVELARAIERGDKYAHRRWRQRSVEAIEAALEHGRRLRALRVIG
ncbi:MAG: alkaline phosphatase family protein [Myxococcales bacterium]|nr:alkaline phosphatase family protein [Myxococcales bacterium]